jgi:hypothetical protein
MGFGLGYAISLGDWKGIEIASGGGLLYLTNFVAMTFTAMAVFVLLRIDTKKVREAVRIWRDGDSESQWWLVQINKIPTLEKARKVRSFSLRLLMILIPLMIIFFPLSSSFSKLRTEITRKQAENRTIKVVRDVWKRYEVDSEGNIRSYLDDLKINETDEKLQIYLRVFDNRPYTQAERKQYLNLVAGQLGIKSETISLQLIEIPTSAREDINPVIETTPTPATVAQRQAIYLQQIDSALSEFKLPPPATIISYSVTSKSGGGSYLEVFYLSSRKIDADGENALQDIVRSRLNLPNIVLVLTPVSSQAQDIKFNGQNGDLVDEELTDLSSVAYEMRRHPKLNLRVLLTMDDKEKELFEKRKKAVLGFFTEKGGIDEERLIFTGDQSDDASNTYQIFLRK